MKSKETLDLEQAIQDRETQKRRYGCKEVTIGFPKEGKGNEICDYISMDSDGILRCFEIKVSKSDLKSKAKKSFYGHYNFLVVSEALAVEISDWASYIEAPIGVMAGKNLTIIRKSKLIKLNFAEETMLKESLLRSLWWKLQSFETSENTDIHKQLASENRQLKKENRELESRILDSEKLISRYTRYQRIITGDPDFDFAKVVEVKSLLAHEMLKEGRSIRERAKAI